MRRGPPQATPLPPVGRSAPFPPHTRHDPIKVDRRSLYSGGTRGALLGFSDLDSPKPTRFPSIHTPLWMVSVSPLSSLALSADSITLMRAETSASFQLCAHGSHLPPCAYALGGHGPAPTSSGAAVSPGIPLPLIGEGIGPGAAGPAAHSSGGHRPGCPPNPHPLGRGARRFPPSLREWRLFPLAVPAALTCPRGRGLRTFRGRAADGALGWGTNPLSPSLLDTVMGALFGFF